MADEFGDYHLRVSSQTLADAAANWLRNRELGGLAPSTQRQYRSSIENKILPIMGSMRLADISLNALCCNLDLLLDNGSLSRTPLAVRLLRSILKEASEYGMLQWNFERIFRLSQSNFPRPLRDLPTLAEGRLLIECADAIFKKAPGYPPCWSTLFKTLIETGIWPHEVRFLIGRSVDLGRCELRIPDPKSHHERRHWAKEARRELRRVPMTATLASEFARLEQDRSPVSSDDFVFPSSRGRILSASSLSRKFARLQLEAGLLRRAAASDELRNPVPRYQLRDLRMIAPSWWHKMGVNQVAICRSTGRSLGREVLLGSRFGYEQSIPAEVTTALERELYG